MMATGRRLALPGWTEPPRRARLCWKETCRTLEPSWLTLQTGQQKGKITLTVKEGRSLISPLTPRDGV